VKKLEQLDELVRSEEEKYKEQYVEKIEYLLDNAKMVLEAKEEDKEVDKSLINLFKDKTYLLVGYCLVNQFITMFNEEGKPKIRVFSATESFMAEHSALLGNVLGKRNVDIALVSSFDLPSNPSRTPSIISSDNSYTRLQYMHDFGYISGQNSPVIFILC